MLLERPPFDLTNAGRKLLCSRSSLWELRRVSDLFHSAHAQRKVAILFLQLALSLRSLRRGVAAHRTAWCTRAGRRIAR